MQRIYLDHNATSPPGAAALEAARAALAAWANPSSPHAEGRDARGVLEDARRQLSRFAGAAPGRVVFTSGGTEAAHLAVRGIAHTRGRGKVVVSELEHACVMAAAAALQAEGWTLATVPPRPDGVIDAERFLEACGPDTAVAALLVAQNEIGTLQPVGEVAEELQARGIPLVCDAVQTPGRVQPPWPLQDNVTAFLSGHKIGGLAGAGAVILAPEMRLSPVIAGGAQERGRRGGTPAVMLAAAMGAAAAQVSENVAEAEKTMRALRDRFETGLLAGLDGVRVLGREAARLPNTCAFCLEGVRGEDVVAALDLAGVAVSTGSACSTGAGRPSASLLALGFDAEAARGLVRVSLGPVTAGGDVDRALAATLRIASRLQRHAQAATS